MAEGLERTQATFMYTYTYDQFTVFFYGDHVFIGRNEYPIGQCCVDVMNLNEAVLKKLRVGSRCASLPLLIRCLGSRIYTACLPGFEHGQVGQLSHLPTVDMPAYGCRNRPQSALQDKYIH